MATTNAPRTVKDVPAQEFVVALAQYFRSTGKVRVCRVRIEGEIAEGERARWRRKRTSITIVRTPVTESNDMHENEYFHVVVTPVVVRRPWMFKTRARVHPCGGPRASHPRCGFDRVQRCSSLDVTRAIRNRECLETRCHSCIYGFYRARCPTRTDSGGGCAFEPTSLVARLKTQQRLARLVGFLARRSRRYSLAREHHSDLRCLFFSCNRWKCRCGPKP